MDTRRAREEAMCGARGDRFGVTDTPLREGLPRATARPTLHNGADIVNDVLFLSNLVV
jgi:hypothetical protein